MSTYGDWEEAMRMKRLGSKPSQMMRKSHPWWVGRGRSHILPDTKIHGGSPLWRIRALLFTLEFWFSTILALFSEETRKEIMTKDTKQLCLRSPAWIYVTSITWNSQNHQPGRHIRSHVFYFSKENQLDYPHARQTESPISLSPFELSRIPGSTQTKVASVAKDREWKTHFHSPENLFGGAAASVTATRVADENPPCTAWYMPASSCCRELAAPDLCGVPCQAPKVTLTYWSVHPFPTIHVLKS